MQPLLFRSPLPVIMQHLSSCGVNDVYDDAPVPPASLEKIVVLVALSRLQSLVEKCPRQFIFPMDL